MHPTVFIWLIRHSRIILLVLLSAYTACHAQERQPEAEKQVDHELLNSIPKLQAQVRELAMALKEMRAETANYRAEMIQIRRELQMARTQLVSHSESGAQPSYINQPSYSNGSSDVARDDPSTLDHPQQPGADQRMATLEEDYQLLAGKVDDQYQTKVETASKYRARLSGIMLLNLFGNRGSVDNMDFPTTALSPGELDSTGTFGATLRQTQLGLEVFGPQLGGAKTSAAIQFDFAGGFPNTVNGVNYGIVRLRTATMRLDWPRSSLVAGQDSLFFAPLSPTSLASLATPALSWAGNLWAWVPQARVEHRLVFSESSSFTFQGGIVDPQTGEFAGTSFRRAPQASEKSHQPGYAARIAWAYGPSERSVTLGVGGYYNRQNWGFERHIDGWAGTADASIPLGSRFSLTGAFYRGRAIGGLEGATGHSIVMSGVLTDPRTLVRGLNTTGGWMQLKFEPTRKLELNAAWGQDNPFARDLRMFFAVNPPSGLRAVARNRSSFANFIYRPRSDLLFSTEYRRMRTWDIGGGSRTADHINVSMGILF